MIDQHAAHERVRLEALLDGMVLASYGIAYLEILSFSELYTTSSSTSTLSATLPPQIKSSKVFPPLVIELQPNEVSLAKLFHQQLKLNGTWLCMYT